MAINQTASESSESNPFSALGEALEAAAESIGDATSSASADASASAKAAALKVQTGVSTGAYYAAYGLSYSLVFSGVFIKELLPAGSPVRRGFEEGAVAAIDAASRQAEAAPEHVDTPAFGDEAPSAEVRKPD